MITDLKIIDDESAVATGELYDSGKVLSAMLGLVEDFALHAKTVGLTEPYTLVPVRPPRPGDDWVVKLFRQANMPVKLPYGPHTPKLILKLVELEKRELDAGGLRHSIEAPPYRFDLNPLGVYPLYANFGMCRAPDVGTLWITCEGGPWTDYDPAPLMTIHRHLPRPPEEAPGPEAELFLTKQQRKIITAFLEPQKKRGITYQIDGHGLAQNPIIIRFPHATFGAGHGRIRIGLLRAGGD
jgi:hypothetical protein